MVNVQTRWRNRNRFGVRERSFCPRASARAPSHNTEPHGQCRRGGGAWHLMYIYVCYAPMRWFPWTAPWSTYKHGNATMVVLWCLWRGYCFPGGCHGSSLLASAHGVFASLLRHDEVGLRHLFLHLRSTKLLYCVGVWGKRHRNMSRVVLQGNKVSEEEIIDQCVLQLFAGHETTGEVHFWHCHYSSLWHCHYSSHYITFAHHITLWQCHYLSLFRNSIPCGVKYWFSTLHDHSLSTMLISDGLISG